MKKGNLRHIRTTGFKTPKAYFETFDDKVMRSLVIRTDLAKTHENAFKVPEHYFKEFDGRVLSALKSSDEPKIIELKLRSSFYYIAGIAASLIILIAIFTQQNSTDELSVDMVENYLVQQDLTSYELAELLSDIDVLSDDFTVVETNYSEEQLETYLLDNANIENIIEQ